LGLDTTPNSTKETNGAESAKTKTEANKNQLQTKCEEIDKAKVSGPNVRVANSKPELSQLLFISIRQRELVKSSRWICVRATGHTNRDSRNILRS